MASISDLPIEILLRIFRFYMQTESQKTFLDNISKVCKAWKNVCLDSSLWTKYDGTPTFDEMIYLSKKGALRNTKEIILSPVDSLKSALKKTKQCITNVKTVGKTKKLKLNSSDNSKCITNEAELFQSFQNVEVISFSLVRQISKEMLSIFAQNCSKLREIKIGKMRKFMITLNYEILVDFFSMRGCGIKKIDFSYCKIPTFRTFIRCISDCCPNLEYLYLMNIDCQGIFPTCYVQIRCPKLKSLYMDQNIRIEQSRHTSGFLDLEEFAYSDQKGACMDDKLFECAMFNSPKLKFLSLTNCKISASVMLSLPACSVEYLYIPRSKACSDGSLGDLLKKWSHSLKEIDLSYGNCYVQHAVLKLIKTPTESPLEFVNLSFTPVKLDLVENIIKDCSHLETLKLEGCRNVMRGMKKTYSGKPEFRELSEKICSYRSTHPPEVFTINDL